jgi:formate/nitrite transporter
MTTTMTTTRTPSSAFASKKAVKSSSLSGSFATKSLPSRSFSKRNSSSSITIGGNAFFANESLTQRRQRRAGGRRTQSSKLIVHASDKTPPETFQAAVATSEKKANADVFSTFALSFTAGALIGFGGLFLTTVGGSSPALAAANPGLSNLVKGLFGLPFGLTMVILTGAELFTGNVFVMLSGLLSKKVTRAQVMKNWLVSYAGNFAGSVFLAYMAYVAMTSAANPAPAIAIATMKATTLPVTVAFVRGVLCNWLVCLAVWGTMASTSVAGKILAIFWPITAFVTMGFEHSIANMFLIPHGMLYGADVSVSQMLLGNILPVTLGNMVGAAAFVAGVHYLAYGRNK